MLPFYGTAADCAPSSKAVKITKADATPLPHGPCRCLLVGTPGTANIVDLAGNVCTNIPLQPGWNPIGVSQVNLGGTADDIWALY